MVVTAKYLEGEIEDYGPVRVRLYDGSTFYLVGKCKNDSLFIGKILPCSPKEYFINARDVKEILD